MMSFSGLVIKGVPLDLVHHITGSEVAESPFSAAMIAFDKARGAGTPLKPPSDEVEDKGPAPYLRKVITDMLVRYVEGGPPTPISEDELSAAAEAHLALIQVVADRTTDSGTPTLPDPFMLAQAEIGNFGMVQCDRPDWLDDAYLRSLVRVHTAAPSATNTPPAVIANPVQRLSAESAFWRSIPAHGGKERAKAEGRSYALASVLPSTYLDIEARVTQNAVNPEDLEDDWFNITSEQLAGKVDGMLVVPPTPDPTGIQALMLSKFKSGVQAPSNLSGNVGAVISPENITEVLSNLDVMRGYVFQSM